MASIAKRILRSAQVQYVLARIVTGYIRLLVRGLRWQIVRHPEVETMVAAGKPFVVCFWHHQLLMTCKAWQGRRMRFAMLHSSHRDGRLIAKAVSAFGIENILGSSGGKKNKQSVLALRQMLRALEDGACVGITPDGPRGPARVVSEGTVFIAQKAGVPLVPIASASRYGKTLSTWDAFRIYYPLGSAVIMWGAPIYVPADADRGQVALQLASALDNLTTQAENHMHIHTDRT